MESGIENAGDAITGGLIARAVEPKSGGIHGETSGRCLNCGAALTGRYCQQCGQSTHVHRSLSTLWHDIAHGVLHLDGKIWRTLPLLFFRPGELTRRYAAGERAKFVSPLAFFLFSVFLMFAVLSASGGPFRMGGLNQTTAEERAELRREFTEERTENLEKLARLRRERTQAAAAGENTTFLDIDIRNLDREIRLEESLFRNAMTVIDAREVRGKALPESERGNKIGNVDTGWPLLDRALNRAGTNPELLAYKLQANAYKFSWAVIPISIPLVWLLFLHRKRYRTYTGYDHAVFVTYSITFMSLGFITLSLLSLAGLTGTLTGLAIAFVPPIHMYRQLRGTYRLSRFSAIWRTFFLLIFALIATTLFMALLLALGIGGTG